MALRRPGGMPLFLLSAPILPAFLFLVPAARAQLVLMLIFFFRRHPAPDMAFRFVDVQYYTRPGCKRRVDMGKALGHIFMHGRFTDPKFPRRLPHCRIVVYDVISDRNRPFLDIFLQGVPLRTFFTSYYICFRFMQIPFPKQKHCRLVVLRTAVLPQVVSLHASFPLCLLLIGLDKQSRNLHRMLVFIQRYHNHISGINQFTRTA